MTGGRVLTPKVTRNTFAEDHGGRNKNMAKPGDVAPADTIAGKTPAPEPKGGVTGRLVEVVEKLRLIKQNNDTMQAQFGTGSSSWRLCESIDDLLHDAFVLLGE